MSAPPAANEPPAWEYKCTSVNHPECGKNNCVLIAVAEHDLTESRMSDRLRDEYKKYVGWQYVKSVSDSKLLNGGYVIHDVADKVKSKEKCDRIVQKSKFTKDSLI